MAEQEEGKTPGLLVTRSEWARELGISVATFNRWCQQGRIPEALDLPGNPRWSRSTVTRVTNALLIAGEGRHFRAARRARQTAQAKGDIVDPAIPAYLVEPTLGIPQSPYVTLEEAALFRRCQLPDGNADLEGMRTWCDERHVRIYQDGLISKRELRIEIERMKNPPPWIRRREKSGY